jgi:hypothetical protein
MCETLDLLERLPFEEASPRPVRVHEQLVREEPHLRTDSGVQQESIVTRGVARKYPGEFIYTRAAN